MPSLALRWLGDGHVTKAILNLPTSIEGRFSFRIRLKSWVGLLVPAPQAVSEGRVRARGLLQLCVLRLGLL